MSSRRFLAPVLCLCSAMLASSAFAQSNDTYLYIVHAAPGRAVSSSTNPELPVDVQVNGQFCIVKGEAFGEIKGPFSAPAGTFSFKVSPANTGFPCTNAPIYQVTTNLTAGQTYFGALQVNGAHQIVGTILTADLSPVPEGQSRVVVANLSNTSLTASLTAASNNETNSLDFVAPGAFQTAMAPSGQYTGSIYVAGTPNKIIGPVSANLMPRDYYVYFLTGSTTNGSVQIVGPKAIRDVF